jgi:hypothetical protein
MKLKKLNQIGKSGLIFENLVDKSLGIAKLKLNYSDRRNSTSGGTREEHASDNCCADDFLANLPELIRLETAASVLGVSIKTIYDWRYRCEQRKIPVGLFVKLNRSVLIRTNILREWIASQNPSLQSGRKQR